MCFLFFAYLLVQLSSTENREFYKRVCFLIYMHVLNRQMVWCNISFSQRPLNADLSPQNNLGAVYKEGTESELQKFAGQPTDLYNSETARKMKLPNNRKLIWTTANWQAYLDQANISVKNKISNDWTIAGSEIVLNCSWMFLLNFKYRFLG